MKISGSFITMLLIWALGFTHFLGGPFILFKIVFWIALLPYIITTIFFILLLLKARKIFSFKQTTNREAKKETIHVEATIKE